VKYSKVPFSKVGIEIEYTDFNPMYDNNLMEFLNSKGWVVTHDASVESPVNTFKGRPIKGEVLDGAINPHIMKKDVIGGEFVSRIIETNNPVWIRNLDILFAHMKRLGEREQTNRGSIHVHINYPKVADINYKLDHLINPWILAGYLEAAFFRLGGFGYKPRGEHMDFIYYRPITKSGPQIIYDGNGYRPLLDYDLVLKSKSTKEFFEQCGDIRHAENRYHPSRYMWINFYNMYHKREGHLEFRCFNKTLNWMYLYAMVELCKHFVAICYKYRTKDLKMLVRGINPLDEPPKNHENYFNNMLKVLNIKNDLVTSILYDIWQKSEWPDYSDTKVFSHLLNRVRVHYSGKYKPKQLTTEEYATVTNPYYIDIHYLKKKHLSVFPENKPCVN
jgi:hypothetical protein